jgi:hypothetical protein
MIVETRCATNHMEARRPACQGRRASGLSNSRDGSSFSDLVQQRGLFQVTNGEVEEPSKALPF